jgi:hypothetical protein
MPVVMRATLEAASMTAATISVQVLSGSKLQIISESGELVAVVKKRVAEQVGINEFSHVSVLMTVAFV